VLVLLACAFQGSRALWEQDESRYVGIALQMLDSGNWWIPEFAPGQPHLVKPPLTYWSIAASMALFGRNTWAARLPYALAFVLTGLLVAALSRTLRLERPWRAALLWASMLLPFFGSNVVMPDPLLALFETLAVLGFARSGLALDAPVERRALGLMWLGFGLAFLAKGTPALLPLLAMAAWLGWRRRWRALAALFIPEGLALFAVLGLGWYVGLLVARPQWVQFLLGHEVVDRIFSDAHNRNGDWIDVLRVYAPTLLLGALPWLPLLLVRRARPAPGVPAPVAPVAAVREGWLGWWFGVPLLVFVLSQSRLPHYLLPLFVPLALMLEVRAAQLTPRGQRRLAVIAAAWLPLLVALKAGAALAEPKEDVRRLARELAPRAAMMSRPLADIAFVDDRPVYGLRLYTGRPAIEVTLRAAAGSGERLFVPATLCSPGSLQSGRLWLVPTRSVAAFLDTAAGCGARARSLGAPVRDWAAYELLPPA